MLAFFSWRIFFRKKKKENELQNYPPRPRRSGNFPEISPTKTGGGWVLAVSSVFFPFVVARDAKKNERRKAKTGGEKKEEGQAETPKEEEKRKSTWII